MSRNMAPNGVTTGLKVLSMGLSLACAAGSEARPLFKLHILSPFSAASSGSTPPTTAAEGYEQAKANGPSFTGTNGPAVGSVFALTGTAATLTEDGSAAYLSADKTTNADGAKITVRAKGVELEIPSLSIDVTFRASSVSGTFSTPLGNGSTLRLIDSSLGGSLKYTELGSWLVDGPNGDGTNFEAFIFGYQTRPASMPKTGTATYSGVENVIGHAFIQGDSTAASPYGLTGDGRLTANFTNGTVTGAFTDMTAQSDGTGTQPDDPVMPWNSVTLRGTITNAVISGTASISSAPGNLGSLAASGTGTIRGGFYGPAANEVALVWTLRDANGSTAVGTFGAATGKAPSDRRLKRDVVAVARLANGLTLYNYAYLGDERRFTGVMAQDLLADPRLAEAVQTDHDGLMRIDYAQLGLIPPDFAAMAAAGERAIALYRAASA